MSRNRRGLRPLSQTGFHRLPRNPNQREPDHQAARTVLDDFNEHLPDLKGKARQLHPTKGWRSVSPKRGRAQVIIAEINNGVRHTTATTRDFLTNG